MNANIRGGTASCGLQERCSVSLLFIVLTWISAPQKACGLSFHRQSPVTRVRLRSRPTAFGGHHDQSHVLLHAFDPRISPHDYPEGTDRPSVKQDADSYRGSLSFRSHPESDDVPDVHDDNRISDNEENRSHQQGNLFDPRLSPHSYPNGTPEQIITHHSRNEPQQPRPTKPQVEKDVFGRIIRSSSSQEISGRVHAFFDPLLSPHEYSTGTPSNVIGSSKSLSKKLLGILLIDHGSRNQPSNDRLHHLARQYQATFQTEQDGCEVIVEAAHMELGQPSIPEGLSRLLDAGVNEIVCHPFFLSAKGRHVSQDIPQIIAEAQQENPDLQRISLALTEPVGTKTDLMIAAIQSLVKESSNLLKD